MEMLFARTRVLGLRHMGAISSRQKRAYFFWLNGEGSGMRVGLCGCDLLRGSGGFQLLCWSVRGRDSYKTRVSTTRVGLSGFRDSSRLRALW
jgi:hypothetical protein